MNTILKQFLHEEEGQSLVEYGMLISLIALALLGAVSIFGGKVADMWGENVSRYPTNP